jgi:hypothetical protein
MHRSLRDGAEDCGMLGHRAIIALKLSARQSFRFARKSAAWMVLSERNEGRADSTLLESSTCAYHAVF